MTIARKMTPKLMNSKMRAVVSTGRLSVLAAHTTVGACLNLSSLFSSLLAASGLA